MSFKRGPRNLRGPRDFYFVAITIESAPTSGSTRAVAKPASFIHPQHCAPV